jgi:hypothetical protein
MSAPSPSPRARSPTSSRPAASSTRPCASASRGTPGLPAPRRCPRSRHHPGQDRRHPPGRGQLDEALHIREQEELPVFLHLGNIHAILVTRAKLAVGLTAPPLAMRIGPGRAAAQS